MLYTKQFKTGINILTLAILLSISGLTYAETSPDEGLTDWSQTVAKRMNQKMERKLQEIVLEAQIVQNLEQESRSLLTATDKEVGCEPDLKLSKI